MSINLSENNRLFSIHTKHTTYQFKVDENGYVIHTYYGSRIDDTDMYTQIPRVDRGFASNPYDVGMKDRTYSLDLLPQEYSVFGKGDYRITSLMIRGESGACGATLKFDSFEKKEGLYHIEGLPAVYSEVCDGETLIIKTKDEFLGLFVELYYGVIEDKDIILRSAKVKNKSKDILRIEKASSFCLDIPYGQYDLLSFYGRHNMERNLQRENIGHGIKQIGSVRGTSSHQYNPFAIVAEKNTNEESGRCYGFAFMYSGNFLMEIERDQTEAIRILGGIHPEEFLWELGEKDVFYTPQMIMAFSDRGLSALSHQFHSVIQHYVIRGNWKYKKCPVLINNWEATFFDFNKRKLLELSKTAENLGVELFVLDDGWFGKRDNDECALGDWYANEKKLGGSLYELAEEIRDNNMMFGLWVEPEAISEDSDLFRAHPDWALTIPGQKPSLGRAQLILDLSRDDVVDYLIESLEKILREVPVSYIKWDMNRSICDKYSKLLPYDRQGEVAHRYVLGLYRILEKIVSDYPDILLEGCSGGGGRFDCGMLYYTPQIWCSDNTDAINRLKIQYGTSFCYPPRTMGAHVSVSPNQQTGRISSFKTRAVVAMAGTFGYELDLRKLSEDEKTEVERQIKFVKEHGNILFEGIYYRLSTPDDVCCAWEFVSEDGSEAMVFAVYYGVEGNGTPTYLKISGLIKDCQYHVFETGWNGEKGIDFHMSGIALENAGLLMPVPAEDGSAVIIHIKKE